jgi:type IV pilus assembly protein PilN
MAQINLLPWREELRNEQQRQFLTILGLSAVLMGMIVLAVHIQIAGMINNQKSRNEFLNTEISKVEKQITEINNLAKEKKSLLSRMEVIETLQRNRPEVVHLFDEIVKVMPEGTYLSTMKQSGKSLDLNGMAQSNARVSALMRNIDGSAWLSRPQLKVIKKDKRNKTGSDDERSFTLRAVQVSQTEENKQ